MIVTIEASGARYTVSSPVAAAAAVAAIKADAACF